MSLVVFSRTPLALYVTQKALKRNQPACLNRPKPVQYSQNAESFLSGSNANFLEAQYLDWSKAKGSIDPSWDNFYNSVSGPQLKIEDFENEFSPTTVKRKDKKKSASSEAEQREKIKLHLAVQQLIRSYQARGHLLAKTDPLELMLPANMLNKYRSAGTGVSGLASPIITRELGKTLRMSRIYFFEMAVAAAEKQRRKVQRQAIRDASNPFELPDAEFQHIYRVRKEMALYICNELEEDLRPLHSDGLPVYIKVLTSLHLLGDGSYQRGIGQDHGLSIAQSTVSHYLGQFVDAVNRTLMRKWVVFPGNERSRRSTGHAFLQAYGVPHILGVIDCTQVKIFPPPLPHGVQYLNRKGVHSLNVQLIADVDSRIISVNARFPGRVHDSFIFNNSMVKAELKRLHDTHIGEYFLLGDSGYALEPWLMTPVLQAAPDSPEQRYTTWHCRVRNTIERTNGYLKNVCRSLGHDRVLHYSPEKASALINTCCVLYNIMHHYRSLPNLDALGAGNVELGAPEDQQNRRYPQNGRLLRLAQEKREEHMDMEFELPVRTSIGGTETKLTLREIIRRLEHVYCGSIGVEYMHLYDVDAVQYLRNRFEKPGAYDKTVEEKRLIMRRLTKAVFLEKYFATKWPAEKRFGLEGGESMIAMLEEIVDTSTKLGVQSIIIGMQHRGRLNMLVNVCRKQLTDIFAQFKPMEPKEPGSGDIKYHLGTRIHRFIRRTNKYIKVSMSANPSHLEVVGPVVAGKTRAEQFWTGDRRGDKTMAIIMHGDAAFSGQGIVYETMHLGNLPGFTTHGTIHIVCNNQIGYTTEPRFSRSSPYCSDCAKCVDSPVFHVNGDDAEAVAHVARVAIEYRCKFNKDVVLDLVCYRRFGHSEEDEPMYTQPFMYKKIKSMKTVDLKYHNKLVAEGTVTDSDIKGWEKEYMDTLNKHFELAKKITKLSIMDWIDTPWTGFFEAVDPKKIEPTGISQTTINTIANHFCQPPEPWAFELHKGIGRILQNREKQVKEGVADWAMGEALAYGSLLRDHIHIRMSGQDVERGTMAHRHHVLHHQGVDGARHNVFDTLYPDQAQYHLHNSSLSEFGILGFETGYSYSSPRVLSLWEAQYGDFADTAQPVFDTFIANAESKWICQSGLVVQLPHGIDGAGPEHSSARVERYLLQADDDMDHIPDLDDKDLVLKQLRACNWIVCNVTSPANYFHMIRRQIAMPFRKPLILFTPKVGLKHPFYRSPFKDFLPGTNFRRAIIESGPASKKPEGVKKLIFCSGKVSIIIDELRKEKKMEDKIAMCRIEQLYPFPYDIVLQEFCRYQKARICFCQEEHKNQGPWIFIKPRIENLLDKKIEIISRPSSAASATGIKWIHAKELKELKEKIIG